MEDEFHWHLELGQPGEILSSKGAQLCHTEIRNDADRFFQVLVSVLIFDRDDVLAFVEQLVHSLASFPIAGMLHFVSLHHIPERFRAILIPTIHRQEQNCINLVVERAWLFWSLLSLGSCCLIYILLVEVKRDVGGLLFLQHMMAVRHHERSQAVAR
jgi:hypothetical protein